MSGILKMPRMGETMEEGRLAAWLVEPGQPFKRGDALLEVETDKTVVEFPALGDGVLIAPLVELGEMVDVGTPIARIDVGDGPDWTDDGRDAEVDEDVRSATASEPQSIASKNTTSDVTHETPARDARRATPVARRVARQHGIDIATLTGSGRRGRIERRDVEAAMSEQAEPPVAGLRTGHGLAWLEKGPAGGAPIVFVHGFAADHSAWAGLQSHMARTGNRTLAVDLPSHGAATAEAIDTDALPQPLLKLAQERLDSTAVHIVAHSMGTIAAVRLAQAHPVASLTLIAPVGVGRRINTGFLDALARPKSADHVKSTLKRLTAGPNGLSDAAIETIFADLSRGRTAALAQSLAGASGQAVDIRTDLANLAGEIPVSVILGHRDQILDWSEALEVSPLICTHHLPDVGHMPHWEAPAVVQAILERKVQT